MTLILVGVLPLLIVVLAVLLWSDGVYLSDRAAMNVLQGIIMLSAVELTAIIYYLYRHLCWCGS